MNFDRTRQGQGQGQGQNEYTKMRMVMFSISLNFYESMTVIFYSFFSFSLDFISSRNHEFQLKPSIYFTSMSC